MSNSCPLTSRSSDFCKGCAFPLQKAVLQPGATVLDLGCGCGHEAMEAAELVRLDDDREQRGQTSQQDSPGAAGQIKLPVQKGFVYGLDTNLAALEQARLEAATRNIQNVFFIEGILESLPFVSSSFEVIISNCVVNLSKNRELALSEAYRVLKPGGQLVIADIISLKPVVSEEAARLAASIFGCTNGVISQDEYLSLVNRAGFDGARVELFLRFDIERVRRRAAAYALADALALLEDSEFASSIHGLFASAYVLARRSPVL